MIEIQIAVSGLALSVTEKPAVTTGNRKSVRAVFDFDGDLWNVCEKRAVFWNTKTPNDIIPMALDVNNSCDVPPYVLTNVGSFCFGVIGLAEDGEIKKVSTILKYPLKEGAPDGTTDVEEMPPDLWEQQLAIMGEAVSAANRAITTATEALGYSQSAVDIADNAVEKLNVCYVDADGYMHVYILENIKGVMPIIHTITDENGAYIQIENMDGSVQNTRIINNTEITNNVLAALPTYDGGIE